MRRSRSCSAISFCRASLSIEQIKSPVELEAFKKKVHWVAIRTALAVICLGLESTGQFTEEELRRLFFNVDLSLAEVESGRTSYEAIERELLNKMVRDEMDQSDRIKNGEHIVDDGYK